MGPFVAPGGGIKTSIPGAEGEWGAGAQLLSMSAATSPLLPYLKAIWVRFSLWIKVLGFFFSPLGT